MATLAEVAAKDGRILAGGQSLGPIMAFRLARPTHLIDINGIAATAVIRILVLFFIDFLPALCRGARKLAKVSCKNIAKVTVEGLRSY